MSEPDIPLPRIGEGIRLATRILALIMAIAFAALIAAQVAFMRVFGVGLTLAVLVDATLVRMALLPAFMHVMGRWNWWAPKPLVRLHERFGFSEAPPEPVPAAVGVSGGG